MKKIIFSALTLLITINVFAQSTLSSIYVPTAGLQISVRYNGSSSLDPGGTGSQTWDFLTGKTYSANLTNTYQNPSSTSYSASYPSANITLYDLFGSSIYKSVSATSIVNYGYVSYNATRQYIYSDGIQALQLPMTYNQTTNDTYSGTGSKASPSTSYTISGTSSTTYDAYGSIKTYHGTYNDVVRIKNSTVETQTNTSNSEVTTITTNTYDWYSTSSGKLVFTLVETSTTTTGGTVEAQIAYSYSYPATTGIADSGESNRNSFLLKSNPVSDQLIILNENLPSGNYEINIYNISGETVLKESCFLNSADIKKVEVSTLSPGAYFVSIMSDDTMQSAVFVKE